LCLRLQESDVVSTLRGHTRSLEAGRPAADDEHATRDGGAVERAPFPLSPDDGVVDAAHRLALDDAVDAARAVAHARPDVSGAPGGELLHEVGLRDVGPDHGD